MEFLKHAALKRVILNHRQGPGQWFMHVCYPSTRTWVWILSNSNKKNPEWQQVPVTSAFWEWRWMNPWRSLASQPHQIDGLQFQQDTLSQNIKRRAKEERPDLRTPCTHSTHTATTDTQKNTNQRACFIVQFRRKPERMDVRINLLSSEHCPHTSASIILRFFGSASAPLLWQSWQPLTKHYITPISL